MSVFHRFRFALAGGASLALLAGFGSDAAGEMAQKPCVGWNTESFFESATAADVSRCVAAGADVGARNDDDRTPLHLAAANIESLPVVRALLEAGAGPEARDEFGGTPLHWATLSWSPPVVAALLDAGADLEARDIGGHTPLHVAAEYSESLPVVRALLKAGADLEARDANGETPLHRAAARSWNLPVIAALLDAGADLEARDRDGHTPLHVAAAQSETFSESGTLSVVMGLLEAGADPEARTTRGMPFVATCGMLSPKIAVTSGMTPLHVAAANSALPSIVTALAAAGAGLLEARDENGMTPLHCAAAYGESIPVIAALLEAGADPAALDKKGRDAARWAMMNDRLPFEAVGLLSAHEFPYVFPYAKDADDTSP